GHDLRRGGRGAVGVPPTGPWTASTPVNDRVVEAEFVFDPHAATDLSVAYAILVPQRRVRIARSGQEASLCHDECGDLRPGVLGPAEEGRHDRVPDRGAALPRRAVGGCAVPGRGVR